MTERLRRLQGGQRFARAPGAGQIDFALGMRPERLGYGRYDM